MTVTRNGDQPRLALFSPLPPQMSGIATYTSRLTAELQHYCDVTVFVGAQPSEVVAPAGVQVANAADFAALNSRQAFDTTLFFMGNSHYHIAMLEVLNRHRGVVLFHDVRLTGLYEQLRHYTPHLITDGSVGATLRHLYPERPHPHIEQLPVISAEVAHQHNIYMAREVVSRADRVLVHSQYAADLLRLDADVDAQVAYPLPCPTELSDTDSYVVSDEVSPALHKTRAAPTLASFGIVAPIKQPERLIQTLAVIHRRQPEARLRFIGAIADPYRSELQAMARQCRVADHVEFTGHLDPDDFTKAQRQASVAIQLRAFSNGESSACVTELLALGIPTVVSRTGAMNELPDAAVAKVDEVATPEDLAALISTLATDKDQRRVVAQEARRFAAANSFSVAAARLNNVLFG